VTTIPPRAGATRAPDASLTLSVVVVTWNRRDDLLRLLDDLARQTEPADEIVVVDNGSSDGAADAAAERYPAVKIVRLPRNLGLSAGRNAGIPHATSDLVAILDNDLRVLDTEFLARVRRSAARHADCGIISFHCSHGLWDDGPLPSGARVLTLEDLQRLADQGQGPVTPRFAYDWFFWGGACAVRRDVFRTVGLFDDDFGYGGEEWDFALRCHAAGVRLGADDGLWVVHVRAPTMRSPTAQALILTNMIFAQARYLPAADVLVLLGVQLAASGVRALREGGVPGYVRAVARLVAGWFGQVWRRRRPVRRSVARRFYFLRTHRPESFAEVEAATTSIWDTYRARARPDMAADTVPPVFVDFRRTSGHPA